MMRYHRIWIILALSIVSLELASADYCNSIKQKLINNEAISKASEVKRCAIYCYLYTTVNSKSTTPDQCFNDFVKPYMSKVLRKPFPTNSQIQDCLAAQNRSKCKDTLLYYFANWYKDHYSPVYEKKYALLLYYTWAKNPDLDSPLKDENFDVHLVSSISHITLDSNEGIQKAIKISSLSDPSIFPVIQSEIRRHCYKPATEYQSQDFCRLRTLMNIVSKIRLLAKGKQKFGRKFQKYRGAVESNFVPFSVLFPRAGALQINPSTEKGKMSILDQQFDELADLTRAGNVENMKLFLQFMPEPYLLEKACKKNDFPAIKRRCCIMEKVVEQLLMYSDMIGKRKSNSKRKAVTVNFSLNLRGVISELRGEEVFKMILDSRYQNVINQQQTTNLIEGKFGQLQNYFSKLQSFNMQKANADVGYIKSRIKYYQGRTHRAIKDVSIKVGGVLRAALAIQALEVAEKAVKLTFAIAEACNPFKTVFNGGTATGILDAMGELMKAIANLVNAIALKNAWTEVIKTVKKINIGFQKNSEFLSAVGRIVAKVKMDDFPDDDEFEQCKSTFLRLYNSYSPKVDKVMLATLAQQFDMTVEKGCGLIDGASGFASNQFVIAVKSGLYCQKAAVSTTSLKTIFEEIYDFQFEFIENMASYLRSATGYHASKQMVTLSGKPMTQNGNVDERKSELKANILLAHTTYEMQKQGVIQSLCDFLEYKEGGQTPKICKEATTDVPALLSYIPKRCKSVSSYVSIPISTEKSPSPGSINISQLYSGHEVSFDIPDYKWLKQNKWIALDENYEAIFIKNFEVFLPTVNQGEKKIRVTVRSMGGNKFQDIGTRYSLIPSDSFSTVYTGGERFYPCSGNEIENPYSICEDRKLPKICILSHANTYDDAILLHPTPFARFKIKAKGITKSQTPDPQSKLDIKARIDMCVFEAALVGRKRAGIQPKPGCCSGNNYWSETQSACRSCSMGSTPNLHGYYCEKNQNALFQINKKKNSSSQ